MTEENTSGHGDFTEIPEEIKKWNWGAFWLTGLWGIFNKTYIALLVLLPVANIIMPFYLGAKGNEQAWRNRRWGSIEEFKEEQRVWSIIGWIFGVIIIIMLTTSLVKAYKHDKLNETITNQVIEIITKNEEVKNYLGDDYTIVQNAGGIQSVRVSNGTPPTSHLLMLVVNFELVIVYTKLDENYNIRRISFTQPESTEEIVIFVD